MYVLAYPIDAGKEIHNELFDPITVPINKPKVLQFHQRQVKIILDPPKELKSLTIVARGQTLCASVVNPLLCALRVSAVNPFP